jgi:hypothetical protein
MKKVVVIVLVLAAAAFAQEPAQPQTAPPAGAQAQQPAAPAQQQKQIKDPAEYNAYMSAVNQTDPAAKAAAFESFLQQYPNSVMKTDALEAMMAAYQEARNPQKTMDAANQLLQADPGNLRALALLAYNEVSAAQAGQNPQQNLALAAQHAQAGMQALDSKPKPDNVSEADWPNLKKQITGIFNRALGINALQNKDYATAQKDLRGAVDLTPNDIQLVYPLALAYLQATPPDYPNGLWFIARAVNLAPTPQAQQQIAAFGRSKYIKYHGGEDGWNDLLAAAKEAAPPAGFAIKPAPTPAEQAHTLVTSKPVNQMNFDDFKLIFTSGTPEDQQTIWNQIKDKPIQFEAKVVTATPTKLTLSAAGEDIANNMTDLEVTMPAPIPAKLVPKPGTMTTLEANPVSYTPAPFLITMNKGALLTKEAPKPAPKPKPAPRRATRRPPPGA